MKILNAKQIYQADKETIKIKSRSSNELMEFAAMKCFDWFNKYYSDKNNAIHIFCGIGNNGGDGLVMARKLIQSDYQVQTYIVNFSDKRSSDFKINLERLVQMSHKPIDLYETNDFPEISDKDIVIDAIFGIGLTRSPQGLVLDVIQKINNIKTTVISIDFPSGLYSEASVKDKNSVIKASHTLTFQNPKLAFLLAENQRYSENWEVIDIGLDQTFIDSVNSDFQTVEHELVNSIHKPRSKFSHKGTFGHSLIIGGSFGKIGAVVLASKAALKIGSGLVTAYIPKCGYTIVQTSIPEVMVEVDDENYLQHFNYKTKANVIGIGIGLGTHLKTKRGFVKFLKENNIPLVIDADALNIIAEHNDILNLIQEDTILTPHPKEFERLAGNWNNDYEKINKQLEFSLKFKCIVVLKGVYTSIAYKGKIYFNTTGNPALATAGSGDVLTGIITGLIAQGYSPINACVFGVYLHGKSADLAINESQSMESFTASNCIDYFGRAFQEIF